jgi:hypothetical protein
MARKNKNKFDKKKKKPEIRQIQEKKTEPKKA